MSVKIFNNQEVQDLLRTAAGLTNEGGSPRAKEIAHRIISDLYKAIDDLNITSDEYWAGVAYLNKLGERGEAGLLSPGQIGRASGRERGSQYVTVWGGRGAVKNKK